MAATKKKPTLGYRMIELLDKKFDELDKDKSGSLNLDELLGKGPLSEKVGHFQENIVHFQLKDRLFPVKNSLNFCQGYMYL